jgi:hypothetical protein
MRFRLCGLAALAAASFSVPASAAWYQAKTAHFTTYADEKPATLQDYATKLEKFDKAVRIARRMDDPPVGDAGRVSIYVLPDADAVEKLAAEKGAAGFYIPRASGSVAFVPRDTGGNHQWDLTPSIVFFHEYAHLMLQNTDAAPCG